MMKNKINLRSFDQSRFFHETALLIVLFVFFTAAFYSIAKSSLSQLSQFSVIVSAVAVYFFGRVGLRVVAFPFSVFLYCCQFIWRLIRLIFTTTGCRIIRMQF